MRVIYSWVRKYDNSAAREYEGEINKRAIYVLFRYKEISEYSECFLLFSFSNQKFINLKRIN